MAQEPAKPDSRPGEKSAPATAADNWERLIYLPYKNLRQVFEKEGATVFMPYSQYLKLWEGLRPAIAGNKPPVAAVITEAAYVGRVEKDIAHIEATLTIQVLGKPWVELPVRFGDAAIGKVESGDVAKPQATAEKVLLHGTGNGTYSLLLPTAGEHKVRLELTTRVRTSPDGRSLEFDVPPSGITTFELTVPTADQTIDVTPQLIVTPIEGDAGVTKIKANLGATRKIAARWHPRVSTAPVMEFLAGVQNTLDVRVADGLVHTQATLKYDVLRGQLDQLRIAVPLKHRVLDVSAAGMKGWKVAAEEKQQVITVDLLSDETKLLTVEVRTEHAASSEAFDVGGSDDAGNMFGIHALGAVRENGLLIVSQAADLAISVEQQTGLVRVEAAEVPAPLRRAESLFYKFYSPKFRLQVAAKPVEPRLLVDHQTRLVFTDDELRLTSQLQYTVERAGVFELRFKLPADLKIDRVDCEQMKEFQTPDGANLLIVSLREKTKGQLTVAVTGHLTIDPAKNEKRNLPLLEPLAVAREQGTVLVFAPEAIEIVTDDKALQSAQPTRPDPALLQQQSGDARLAAAWTYTRRPVEIPVTTSRKPTRLTATVGTTINVRQELVEVVTLLNYHVQYAGIDTFRFALPEAVAATAQIEPADVNGAAIKQKTKSDPANGWVTWTVVMQRELSGVVPLRVKYDFKPQQNAGAATFAVSPLRVLDSPGKTMDAAAIKVVGLTGEITVQKDRALSISAKGSDLEAIDVRELSTLPQEGYLAYRYFRQPESFDQPFLLDLQATRHEIQPVVETVIRKALVEAVVTDEKAVTYRCRYQLKTSERQRLAVDLPNEVEPLDTLVAGKSVDLEKAADTDPADNWQPYYVNVARKTRSDEPFVLTLVFRAPYKDRPLRQWGGRLALALPRIGGAGSGESSAVAVQQLRVAVWVPREFALVGKPEHFTPDRMPFIHLTAGAVGYHTDTTELETWFGEQSGGLYTFPTAGHAYTYSNLGGSDAVTVDYWRSAYFTWVISGSIFAIGFILLRTSWENKLTILLVTAFAAVLYTLYDADQVIHALAAARFGLLATLVLWLVHALNRTKSTAVTSKVTAPVTVTTDTPPNPEGV